MYYKNELFSIERRESCQKNISKTQNDKNVSSYSHLQFSLLDLILKELIKTHLSQFLFMTTHDQELYYMYTLSYFKPQVGKGNLEGKKESGNCKVEQCCFLAYSQVLTSSSTGPCYPQSHEESFPSFPAWRGTSETEGRRKEEFLPFSTSLQKVWVVFLWEVMAC